MTQWNVEKIVRTYLAERGALHEIEHYAARDGQPDEQSTHSRLMEVEAENLRLQRLVAELLIKNQTLRDTLYEHAV